MVGACLLAACATSPPVGDLTCFEFGQLTPADRSVVLRDLLDEGGLNPGSAVNALGVQRAVDRFCGTSSEPWAGAGRNLNDQIRAAVDWSTGDW